jgi:hypothetical protein
LDAPVTRAVFPVSNPISKFLVDFRTKIGIYW